MSTSPEDSGSESELSASDASEYEDEEEEGVEGDENENENDEEVMEEDENDEEMEGDENEEVMEEDGEEVVEPTQIAGTTYQTPSYNILRQYTHRLADRIGNVNQEELSKIQCQGQRDITPKFPEHGIFTSFQSGGPQGSSNANMGGNTVMFGAHSALLNHLSGLGGNIFGGLTNKWFFPPPPPKDGGGVGGLNPVNITETLSLDDVGGLGKIIEALDSSVLTPFINQGVEGNGKSDIPKGILFHGPPGTGKTLLAKTLAVFLNQRMDVPVTFFQIKGSELFDKYIGETEKKLRTLFAKASQMKPSVIFFDEFDALCPSRAGGDSTTGHFRTSIVDTLLGTLDEVVPGEILIIGATNLLDTIDPAIRRPGRFDNIFAVPLPDEQGRRDIFSIHSKKCGLEPSTKEIEFLAKGSTGFSGADIRSVCLKSKKIARERIVIPDNIVRFSKEYYQWRQRTNIHVTFADWKAALESTSPSGLGCFGSSIYKPQAPPVEVQEILQPLIATAQAQITYFCRFASPGIQTYLFWGTSQGDSTTLNNRILPDLLSKAESNVPVFLINMELLVSEKRRPPIALIRSVIDELNLSGKCGVLVIQDLDKIIRAFQSGFAEIFANQLKEFENKRVLIIATSSSPIENIPSIHFQKLFSTNYSFQLKLPSVPERSRMFENILKDQMFEDFSAKDRKQLLEMMIQRSMHIGAQDDFEDLLKLRKELLSGLKIGKPTNRLAAQEIIKNVFISYEQGQL